MPILGGARLTGRIGRWELGLIEMQTDKVTLEEGAVPSENFGVFRLKRETREAGSYLGGMLTSRTDFKGNHNLVYAADGDIRIFGPQYLKFQFGQSRENDRDLSGSSFGAAASHIGADFNPGMGFLNRPGVNCVTGRRREMRSVMMSWEKGAVILAGGGCGHRFHRPGH